MTALPDYLPPIGEFPTAINVDEPDKIKHNWLYSVVPVSERVEDYNRDELQVSYPLHAYLTGYCRNCNTAFSRKIGADTYYGYYSETSMNIPKEGCVIPE